MSNTLLFVTLCGIALFEIVFSSFVMVRFTDTQKQLRSIEENQFDAEEVMKLYALKYMPRPTIMRENKNVVELFSTYELPYEYIDQVTEEEIHMCLAENIAKELGNYIEVVSDKDIVRMSIQYRARLRVVEKQKGSE